MKQQDRYEELSPQQRELALRLRQALRESESLDYVTASKLAAARARALQPARSGWNWAAGSGAVAAMLAVAILAPWRTPAPPAAVITDTAQLEALDALGDEMEPEFYEDLEFYQWLALEQAQDAGQV